MQFLYLLLVSPILTWAPYGKIFLTVPSKSVPSLRFNISCKILWQLRSSFKKQWKKKGVKLHASRFHVTKEHESNEIQYRTDPSFPFAQYQVILGFVYSSDLHIHLASHLHQQTRFVTNTLTIKHPQLCKEYSCTNY